MSPARLKLIFFNKNANDLDERLLLMAGSEPSSASPADICEYNPIKRGHAHFEGQGQKEELRRGNSGDEMTVNQTYLVVGGIVTRENKDGARKRQEPACIYRQVAVSYTHLTLPTKRIV